MEELEIVLECETNEEQEIELISEGTIIYPQLEDLTITPSREQQIFNHPNSYGYDNVIVEAIEDFPEDLTSELTEQDNLLTAQERKIEDIILELEDKSASGGISPIVEGNTLILSGGKIEGGVLSI